MYTVKHITPKKRKYNVKSTVQNDCTVAILLAFVSFGGRDE